MLLVKRLAFFILFSILILNSSTVDSGDDEDMDVATIEDIPLSVASSGNLLVGQREYLLSQSIEVTKEPFILTVNIGL